MLLSVIPIGRHQAVLAIFLILALEQSLTTSKSIVATLIAPKQSYGGTWVIRSRRQRHRNKERDQEMRTSRNSTEDVTPSLYYNSFLKITRGGGNTAKSSGTSFTNEEPLSTVAGTKIDKGLFVNRYESTCDDVVCSESTIITIGVIDLSGIGPNSPDLCSSIVLVVDGEARNDDITVDDILLQRNLVPLFQDKKNDASIEISSKERGEDVNTILESLALLCDVLVVRIGEEETLAPEVMTYVVRGNRQRKSAGMAGGRLWLSATKGHGHELRRLICNSDNDEEDDNRYHASTTTWSALFSSSEGEIKNDDKVNGLRVRSLKELFTSLSQQVIRSKRCSTPKSEETTAIKSSSEDTLVVSFPTVSMLYINKKSGQSTLRDDEIKQASFSTRKESINVKQRTQTSSRFTKIPDENKTERTNQQDNDEIIRDVIGMAYRRLEDLEVKMQELVLGQSFNPMPLLEFGNLVQDILQTTETQLNDERGMHNSFRRGLMKGIVVEVQRLYKDQLQALRNYYGQRYESILDEELDDDIHNDETIDRKWAIGADHMTQTFLAAALNAVPAMYRTDLKDSNNDTKTRSPVSFDHVGMLQGLIQDMIESTERRKDDQDIATMLVAKEEEEETADSTSTSARIYCLPKLPKWLERLAAKAFVFGVNYVQGWLAWQGIKRAALERDRNQPKFPLF